MTNLPWDNLDSILNWNCIYVYVLREVFSEIDAHPHLTLPIVTLVLVDYNEIISHFNGTCSCEIPMGDLQSEEERDIVLELKLPAVSSPQQDTVLRTTLSYFNVITSELDTVQSELILSRGGENLSQYYAPQCSGKSSY